MLERDLYPLRIFYSGIPPLRRYFSILREREREIEDSILSEVYESFSFSFSERGLRFFFLFFLEERKEGKEEGREKLRRFERGIKTSLRINVIQKRDGRVG